MDIPPRAKRSKGKSRQKMRARVLRRDGGICCRCGRDCKPIDGLIVALRDRGDREGLAAFLAMIGLSRWSYTSWQADHIIPLADGGANTLTNLQTLCEWCHDEKTKADRKPHWRRRPPEPTA
jgi:5-methylcytosine-specific restriction endonuclease McrA